MLDTLLEIIYCSTPVTSMFWSRLRREISGQLHDPVRGRIWLSVLVLPYQAHPFPPLTAPQLLELTFMVDLRLDLHVN